MADEGTKYAAQTFGAPSLPDHLFTDTFVREVFVVFVYRESAKWWERYRDHDDRERAVALARDLAEKGTPAAVMRQKITQAPMTWVMSAVPEEIADGR